MCVFSCYMVRFLFSHAYMLGFRFFHVYVLGLYMLMCMFLFLLVLIYVFTCFILSSMCLCAPCHVCVPRPRLCLSCHVLLWPFCCFVFLSCVLAYWFGPDLDPMVFVIVHTPWPISKGFTNPILHVYACLLLYFMLV